MGSDKEQEKAVPGGLFVNIYEHSLDAKRRLTIPVIWRKLVGDPEELLVMPDVNERCLNAHPSREMSHRLDMLRKKSLADEQSRRMARRLGHQSDLVGLDKQGRIRIKDSLLAFVGIEEKVVLVGTFDGFEIWNPDDWQRSQDDPDGPSLKDAMKYVGF